VRDHEPPPRAVVSEETNLEPLEFPQVPSLLPQRFEVLSAGDISVLSQAFEQDRNPLAILKRQSLKEEERRDSSPRIDRPLNPKLLPLNDDAGFGQHWRVYL
jgi:hypothetical protein